MHSKCVTLPPIDLWHAERYPVQHPGSFVRYGHDSASFRYRLASAVAMGGLNCGISREAPSRSRHFQPGLHIKKRLHVRKGCAIITNDPTGVASQ